MLGLAGWLSYLVIRSDGTGALRHQLESGALLFVVAGTCFRSATAPRLPFPAPTATPSLPGLLALTCGLALALYWPALRIGYLSDDFILVEHARAWHVGAVAAQLFRPLPLTIWAILLSVGAHASGIHALNILLHGSNACLTACIARAWVPGRWWPAIAGMLFLISPLAPEAVAWSAGVFDLAATAFVLLSVLVARRYDGTPTVRTLLVMSALSLAALLSKETAAIGPLLIATDAWVRKSFSKRLIRDLLLITTVLAAVMMLRIWLQGTPALPPITKYRLQRVLFDSFASLVAPWHAGLFGSASVIFSFSQLSAILLFAAFFLTSGSARATRAVVAGAVWILASLIPAVPLFYISPSLEGSRYLYLPAVGWALILVVAAAEIAAVRRHLRILVLSFIGVMIGIGGLASRVHLRPWTQASALRDVVLSAASTNRSMHECDVVSVQGLPSSTNGAYLFSNGAREAFADIGLNVYIREESGACTFRWNRDTSEFIEDVGRH